VDAGELLGAFVGGVGGRGHDPGVVVDHVEPSEGFDRAVDGGGDLVLVRDVADQREAPVAVVGELLCCGVDGVLVDVGEGDGGARGGGGAGGGQAYAGGGVGDEGDLAGEVVGGVMTVAPNEDVPK
jgi:hypothetical protein